MEIPRITYTDYIDLRYGKLVIVERKTSDGSYGGSKSVDSVVGSLFDVLI